MTDAATATVGEYATPEDLVERYRGRVTKRTLNNWRCNKEGPLPTKIGGRVLYKWSDVFEWERSRQPKSTRR